MKPWEHLGSGAVPGDGGTMELLRRGDELVIRVDGKQLMNTHMHGSEDALADLAFERLDGRPGMRALIGGLGMGFTLAAVLRRLPPEGVAVVAELVPVVIEWNRGPLADAANRPLEDARASVHQGDVSELIRESGGGWDAILLDVDNGPDGLTRASNNWLYGKKGLDAAFAALRPGGVLGVWSVSPDDAFTRRVQQAGFDVEPVKVRARGKKGSRHVVWIGVRPGKR